MTMPPRSVVSALVLLISGVAAGCGSAPAPTPHAGPEGPPGYVELTDAQRAEGGIEVHALEVVEWAEQIDAPAVVAVDDTRTSHVGALLDARVEHVHAQVGDRVRAGAVLADLHSHVTHDIVAALRKAISAGAQLDGELAYAEASQARAQRLLTDGAASPQDVERATTTVASLRREIEMARADEVRARAELRHYGVDLAAIDRTGPDGHPEDRMPVRAPQAGVVLERLVTPGTAVTSGQPLFVVSDLSRLWVVAEIPEQALASVARGRTAQVRVPAWPGETFEATVTYIGDVVTADTRRVTVRAEVANGDARLKPEMYATMVLAGARRDALALPADAVQRLDGRDVVFVEEIPGRFVPRDVRTAPLEAGRVAILDGVQAGARVVTRGAFLVRSELQRAAFAEDE